MWPLAKSSTGPVKTSPLGKLRCPSELLQRRPATLRVRSVSSVTKRRVRLVASMSHSTLLFVVDGPPGGYRIGLIEQAGAVDEVLVVGQAHLGLLGTGLGGEECAATSGGRPGRRAPCGAR